MNKMTLFLTNKSVEARTYCPWNFKAKIFELDPLFRDVIYIKSNAGGSPSCLLITLFYFFGCKANPFRCLNFITKQNLKLWSKILRFKHFFSERLNLLVHLQCRQDMFDPIYVTENFLIWESQCIFGCTQFVDFNVVGMFHLFLLFLKEGKLCYDFFIYVIRS